MSKESLTKLILGEAQREADKIVADARVKIEEIKRDESKRLASGKIKLEAEFKKKKNILASSKTAKINSMGRASELKVIHQMLDKVKRRSAEMLLSDSDIRQRLRDIASKWSGGILSVGVRIAESLPEILKNTSVEIDDKTFDYAMVFSSGGVNEVVDLTYECGRIVDANADEYVTILTSP